MRSDVFAAELRRQCSRFRSISEVCQKAQINRQQFNKYLSGKMLPNARSMRRICEALGVSEASLLLGATATQAEEDLTAIPNDTPSPEYMGSIEMLSLFASQRLGKLTGGNIKPGIGVLPAGYYFCYFPLQTSSPVLLRTLVSLKERAGVMYFSRRTFVPKGDNESRPVLRGKHLGVVLSTSTEAYLIGFNRLAPHQLSFLTVNTAPVMSTRYSGLCVTKKGLGQIATTASIQYLGRTKPSREIISSLGVVNLSDPALDPIVALLMRTNQSYGFGQIQALHFDQLLESSSATFPVRVHSSHSAR